MHGTLIFSNCINPLTRPYFSYQFTNQCHVHQVTLIDVTMVSKATAILAVGYLLLAPLLLCITLRCRPLYTLGYDIRHGHDII